MRAIVTTANGNVSVMKVQERPDPVPKKGQVLVRVKAAGIGVVDLERKCRSTRLGCSPIGHDAEGRAGKQRKKRSDHGFIRGR